MTIPKLTRHLTDFQREGETNVNAIMPEGYVPEFSGLLSEAWAPLLYGPAQRATEDYASSQESDRKLDRVDFLAAFGTYLPRWSSETALLHARNMS